MTGKPGHESAPSSGRAPLSRRKRRLFTLILFLLSVFLKAATAEAYFRVYRALRKPAPLVLFGPNPNGTGSYRLLPCVDLMRHIEGRKIRIRTNSSGMPWREVCLGKPAGAARVAFLGDSFTFGFWADSIEKSFVGVFDASFPPGRLDVLDLGVGGYGLDDMEPLLQEEVLRFHPDHAVVMFYDGNDFRDTYLGIGKLDISGSAPRGRLPRNTGPRTPRDSFPGQSGC